MSVCGCRSTRCLGRRESSSSSAHTCGVADSCRGSSSTTRPTSTVQATSSSFLISMLCAISTRSCRSTCNRATSSHFTTAPCIQRRVPPAERLHGDEPSASAISAATRETRRGHGCTRRRTNRSCRGNPSMRSLSAGVDLTATNPGAPADDDADVERLAVPYHRDDRFVAGHEVANSRAQPGLTRDRLAIDSDHDVADLDPGVRS